MIRALSSGITWRRTGEFSWVMAGQGAALVGSVGLTKMLTSRLGTDQYGRFALGLTIAVFLNQFLFGPITVAGVRFFSAYRDSFRLAPFMRALSRMVGLTIAGVGVAALVTIPFVYRRYGFEWAALIGIAAAYGIAQNVFGLYNGLDAAARNRGRVALHQAADPLLRLAVAAIALTVLRHEAWCAMLGVTVATAILMTSQVVLFRRDLPASAATASDDDQTAAAVAALRGYGKYFVAAGIFTSLQLSSDRWALKVFLDDATVGIYAAAYQLASVPSVILAGCISQFFSPIVFQRAQDGTSVAGLRHARQAIFIGTALLGVLVLASTVGAAAVGAPLIVLFTSRAYQSSGPFLAPLVLGLGLLQIGHMLSLVPMSSNRLKGHLAVRIVHGIVATVLNMAGARYFGVKGLCYAAVAGGTLYVALVLWNNARILRSFPIPEADPAA